MNEVDLLHINVHALGKFKFCPRAGVLAFESEISDEQDNEGTPRLDHLPLFDIDLMNKALKTANEQQLKSGLSLLALGMGLLMFGSFLGPVLAFLLVSLLLILSRKTYLHWSDCRELTRRLALESTAEASKLGDPGAGVRQINWWGLAKDEEFQSVTPQARYVDRELRLAGKPPRLATYRGSRIPVIFYHGELDYPKPYHKIRLAAYSLLIEKNQRGDSVQWGIILDPSSMKGLAVPINETDKQEALDTLNEFRRDMIETRNGTAPVPPAASACTACPLGRPRKHVRGKTDTLKYGKKLPPRLNRGAGGRSTHSNCGDRFDWIPPHGLAIEQGLREA
jgi:hypothetical protein